MLTLRESYSAIDETPSPVSLDSVVVPGRATIECEKHSANPINSHNCLETDQRRNNYSNARRLSNGRSYFLIVEFVAIRIHVFGLHSSSLVMKIQQGGA